MAEQDLRRVYRGTASLDETERACENAQMSKRMQIQKIQMGVAEIGGGEIRVNVVDFKSTPISQILDDLEFIDMSLPTGATDANVISTTHTFLFTCSMFVGEIEKTVKVFGRKST
jgi:hypothetical protein